MALQTQKLVPETTSLQEKHESSYLAHRRERHRKSVLPSNCPAPEAGATFAEETVTERMWWLKAPTQLETGLRPTNTGMAAIHPLPAQV